jgi:hypothetical protein
MILDILCEVKFNPKEEAALDSAARRLGMTKEEVVRKAVKVFATQCVPTHLAPRK